MEVDIRWLKQNEYPLPINGTRHCHNARTKFESIRVPACATLKYRLFSRATVSASIFPQWSSLDLVVLSEGYAAEALCQLMPRQRVAPLLALTQHMDIYWKFSSNSCSVTT